MLTPRSLGLLTLAAIVCIGLYIPLQRAYTMTEQKPSTAPGGASKPQPRVSLEVVSVDKAADTSVPKVQLLAYVENASDDTIKVLRWNSVLDPQAGLLGAISLRNKQTAKTIDVPTIKINRQMPPPDEEYVRIEPHSKASNQITLALATTKLEEGADYEALAEGRFMEIYSGDQQGGAPGSMPYSCEPIRFTA